MLKAILFFKCRSGRIWVGCYGAIMRLISQYLRGYKLSVRCCLVCCLELGLGGGGGSPLDYSVQRCCEIDMKLGRIRSPPTLPIMYTPGFKAKFQQLS